MSNKVSVTTAAKEERNTQANGQNTRLPIIFKDSILKTWMWLQSDKGLFSEQHV